MSTGVIKKRSNEVIMVTSGQVPVRPRSNEVNSDWSGARPIRDETGTSRDE